MMNIKSILIYVLDLRKSHKNGFSVFQRIEDNPLKYFSQTAGNIASPDSDLDKTPLVFICKQPRLNYGKLSGEEKRNSKLICVGEINGQFNKVFEK